MSYVHTNKMKQSKVSSISATKFAENRTVIRIENLDYFGHQTGTRVETIYTIVSNKVFVDTIEGFIDSEAKSVEVRGADNVFGSKDSIKFDRTVDGFYATISIGVDKCSCFMTLENLKEMLNHIK